MAELFFNKTLNGLVPADEHSAEVFKKWKAGGVIRGEFKQVRNGKYHRRFFALLNLTFDYWEPSAGVLTEQEKRIITKFVNLLEHHSGNSGTIKDLGRQFLKQVAERRKESIPAVTKSFEAFRKQIIIDSGFYSLAHTTSGIKKEADSISFANMDEDQFRELYRAVFSTAWNQVLSKTFPSEQEAQNAIDNLLSLVG